MITSRMLNKLTQPTSRQPNFHKTDVRQLGGDSCGCKRGGGRTRGADRGGGRGRGGDVALKLKTTSTKIPIEEVVCMMCDETGHLTSSCAKAHPKFKAAKETRENAMVAADSEPKTLALDSLRMICAASCSTTKRWPPTALQTALQAVMKEKSGRNQRTMRVLLLQQ